MRKGASRGLSAFVVAVALSCGDGDMKEVKPYTYEGCADDNTDCPGETAFVCALGSIASRYGTCSQRSDCMAAGPDAGSIFPAECVNPCLHAAVNREQEQAYLAETRVETYRYCNQKRCTAYPFCPRPSNATIDCVDGGCMWVEGVWRLPDAGRLDAAQPGLDAAVPPGPDAATPVAGPDAATPPGPDAATPAGLDAAPLPGPDAAAPPGLDAATPAGPDAESPGLDAAEPGLDAAAEEDTGA
ncbi:MAG: hypothetical protein HY901_00730 [Deltaproteobacteria bacterium]|nr:hypothetical protein [Deltaproteobacteria bacterium]